MKKEIKLLPGYIILIAWVLFTVVLLGWVVAASLSTTADIFSGDILGFKTGIHFENYRKAWVSSNVSVFFTNSLVYAVLSCTFLILICAPYAYVLQRFEFWGRKTLTSALAGTMGVPLIMVIIPLYTMVARTGVLGNAFSNGISFISTAYARPSTALMPESSPPKIFCRIPEDDMRSPLCNTAE
ncbi:MAG: hypothetical protein ACFNTU_01210 [Catonella sp.]